MRQLRPTSWLKDLHATRKMGDPVPDIPETVALVKALPVEVKVLDDGDCEFIISTADVDRENDIIAVDGWDLANYVRNPVVLFAHDYWSPPVAMALRTWVEAGTLRSRCHFTEPDLYAFGAMIGQMYARGFMRATSVGFRPKEWTFDQERGGLNFLRQELLEYSCVPVPANPEALIQARSAGIDTAPMKAWAERALAELQTGKATGLMAERLERMRKIADPAGRSLALIVGEMKLPAGDQPHDATRSDSERSGGDEGQSARGDEGQSTAAAAASTVTVTATLAVGELSRSVSVTAPHGDEAALKALLTQALKATEAPIETPASDPPPADSPTTTDPPAGDPPTPPAEEASAGATTDDDGEAVLVLAEPEPEPTVPVDEDQVRAAVREAVEAAIRQHQGRVD